MMRSTEVDGIPGMQKELESERLFMAFKILNLVFITDNIFLRVFRNGQ